jgi:hypothetical protein
MKRRCRELIQGVRRVGTNVVRFFDPEEEMSPRLDLAVFSTPRSIANPGRANRYMIKIVNPDGVPVRTVLTIHIVPLERPDRPFARIRQSVEGDQSRSLSLRWDFDWLDACTASLGGRPLAPAAILLNRDALREGFYRLTASLPGRKSHRLSIHQRLIP